MASITAIPGVRHPLKIFREENGVLVEYRLVLDSRRVVIEETRVDGGETFSDVPPTDISAALRAQLAYFDKHGYRYKIGKSGGILIEHIPALELILSTVVTEALPCPDGFPVNKCMELRQSYRAALEVLQENDPDCTDCEKGKVKRRFMDMARLIVNNAADEQLKEPCTRD